MLAASPEPGTKEGDPSRSGCVGVPWLLPVLGARAAAAARKVGTLSVPGCRVGSSVVDCDPEAMRASVERTLIATGLYPPGRSLSLEAYAIARNVASEAGSEPIAHKVGVAEAAVSRAAFDGVPWRKLLLKDGARFGHQRGTNPAVSTAADPRFEDVVIAELVLGRETDDFARGAVHYFAPKAYPVGKAIELYENRVRNWGDPRFALLWVGPLPGVDPQRQFFMAPVHKSNANEIVDREALGRSVIVNRSSPMAGIVCGDSGLSSGGRGILVAGLGLAALAGAGVYLIRQRALRGRWF